MSDNYPMIKNEREFFGRVSEAMEMVRELRDAGNEHVFRLLYGQNLFEPSQKKPGKDEP